MAKEEQELGIRLPISYSEGYKDGWNDAVREIIRIFSNTTNTKTNRESSPKEYIMNAFNRMIKRHGGKHG